MTYHIPHKTIRVLSAFLSAVLLFASVPLTGLAASPGRYVVRDDAAVYKEPDMLSDKAGEVYAGTVVDVTDISYGYGEVFLPSSGIAGWIPLNAMQPLGEPGATEVTGLSVTPPEKLVYVEGEEKPDLTGLEVFALLKDGTREKIGNYSVFFDSLDSCGDKQVRVTYSPEGSGRIFTASFGIRVIRVPLVSLTVAAPPAKTVYNENDTLSFDGLVLCAAYSDGRPDRYFTAEDIFADGDFTVVSCCDNDLDGKLKPGTHRIAFAYKYPDIACSTEITVGYRTLTSVRLLTPPEETVIYTKTEMPSVKGLTLEAAYDNGETETVPYYDCEVVCDPSTFVLGPGNIVKVRYEGREFAFDYRLALNEPVGIRAIPPQILSFVMGDTIDFSDLRVELVYADRSAETVTGFTVSEIDPELQGSQNVIVTYGEYSDVFTIYITPYYRKGDVDGNGKVEPADARLTLRASVGLLTLAGFAFTAADADADGNISPADARQILRASVGLEND